MLRLRDRKRDDVGPAPAQVEALGLEPVAKGGGVDAKFLDQARALLEQPEGGQRAGDRRRRRRGREHERPRGMQQVLRHHPVAGRERAVGAERLTERADDHVHLILEAAFGQRAASARSHRPEAVRLVHQHPHAVALRELDDLLERRHVAVEREHRVGGDQRRARVRLREPPGEVLGVAVVVHEYLGPREPAAVDQRGVVELVGEHDVARAGQRGDDPGIGEEARAEQERAVAPHERGEPLLEAAVNGHRSRREPGGAGAHPPAHRGLRGGLANPRVIGQPEAVVRAQQQHGLAVEHHVRPLRPADQPHAMLKAQRAELAEAGLDLDHGGPAG